jgi:hypothetical protein
VEKRHGAERRNPWTERNIARVREARQILRLARQLGHDPDDDLDGDGEPDLEASR